MWTVEPITTYKVVQHESPGVTAYVVDRTRWDSSRPHQFPTLQSAQKAARELNNTERD